MHTGFIQNVSDNKPGVLISALCLTAFLGCNGNGSANQSQSVPPPLNTSPVIGAVIPSNNSSTCTSKAAWALKHKSGLRQLVSHIPHRINHLADAGKMELDQDLPVTVALNLNNESELDQKLSEMYRPGHPSYHQFLSPQAFRERYAPTHEQVEHVKSYLMTQGITPVSVNENQFLIHAHGKIKALNSVFHTEVHSYKDAQGHSYFAPIHEFQVPSDVPIQAVHGLQNITRLKNYAQPLVSPTAVAHAGTGPRGGLTPSDIQKAYRLPNSLNGKGETLALFELDGYSESDITSYEQNYNLPAVPLKNVLVNQASGTPSGSGGENEVTLDIELMIAIAPGATQILVYEGTNDDQGILETYSKIANDNLAREISTSWGTTENLSTTSITQTENNIFKQMAAQGQSFYAAAGDNGAYDDGSNLSVDDPGSQPYVVAVGGTKLTVGNQGTYGGETTWNVDGTPTDGAGGGGISTLWSQPEWQKGLNNSSNKGSASMRNSPDVSLNADPQSGYSIYTGGQWTIFGGTSCAAPLWAAFTALVNQQRIENNLSPLGFANPALYQIGQSDHYQSDFFDISDESTNIYYPAVKGYDDATGWGSFNGEGLLQDLAQTPTPAPIASGMPETTSGSDVASVPTAAVCN